MHTKKSGALAHCPSTAYVESHDGLTSHLLLGAILLLKSNGFSQLQPSSKTFCLKFFYIYVLESITITGQHSLSKEPMLLTDSHHQVLFGPKPSPVSSFVPWKWVVLKSACISTITGSHEEIGSLHHYTTFSVSLWKSTLFFPSQSNGKARAC